jgi:hypothetical protein
MTPCWHRHCSMRFRRELEQCIDDQQIDKKQVVEMGCEIIREMGDAANKLNFMYDLERFIVEQVPRGEHRVRLIFCNRSPPLPLPSPSQPAPGAAAAANPRARRRGAPPQAARRPAALASKGSRKDYQQPAPATSAGRGCPPPVQGKTAKRAILIVKEPFLS